MLKFTKFTKHGSGVIASLLYQSYEEYFHHDPNCESAWKKAWVDYDRAVFENPDTIGACGFIMEINTHPIGFASWDPRQFPLAVIGHNCVIPEFRGNLYGTRQIKEVLRILKHRGFAAIKVTTGEHDFFEPARRMYQGCGFEETTRGTGDECSKYGTVTYEVNFATEE